jgi:hypothetical protein
VKERDPQESQVEPARERRERDSDPETGQVIDEGTMDDDEKVDEASEESFPSSDPPAF